MSRKHRCNDYRSYKQRRRSGWGINLYRNTRDARIGGVAAGLADHWDVAHWVVRLLWVGALLFTGTLALWAYLAGWFLLSPRPSRRRRGDVERYADTEEEPEEEVAMEYDERYQDYRPRKAFRYSEASSVRLRRARERLDRALRRVEKMESYITSRRYNLNKEFSQL